jgi:transcription initiation factor IIE alpha subunit
MSEGLLAYMGPAQPHRHSVHEALEYGRPCPICAAKELIKLRKENKELREENAELHKVADPIISKRKAEEHRAWLEANGPGR